MAQLTGNKIKDTYLGLLKTNGSGILTSGFQRITDGSGLGSQLYLSLTQIKFHDAYIFPNADGSADQVLSTDGSGALSWKDDANSGTVTSVALSVPTGLTVTNSPITTSGTIAIANTSGYSIPTDAKQTQWDTAYTNRITTATSPLSFTTNTISLNTVPVSNGGTGATTLTGILLGDGTNTITAITDGSADTFLKTDGSGGYSFSDVGGGDVLKTGTIAQNRIAIWNDNDSTLRSDATLTIDADHKITLFQPNPSGGDISNYNIGGGNQGIATGANNIGFGIDNLNSLTTGYSNIAIGYALEGTTTGYENICLGSNSLFYNDIGSRNICIGIQSLFNNRSGTYNISIGHNSLITTQTGINNIGIGKYSLQFSTGSGNIAIGSNSGSALATGSYNVIIGTATGSTIDGLSNRIIISDGGGNVRQTFDDSGAATFLAGTNRITLANNFDTTGNTSSPKLSFFSFGDTATYPVTGPSIQKINTGSYGEGRLVFFQHEGTDFTNETEALSIASTGAATFSSTVQANGAFRQYITAGYYADFAYNGTTYNLGSSEATDNIDFKIAGGTTFTTGGNFRFWTQEGNSTPVERVRITSGGNVGIGTNHYPLDYPNSKLHVYGTRSDTVDSANAIAKIGGSDVYISFGALNGTPNYGAWIQALRPSDNAAFPLSLNSQGGNVLIGTTTDAGYKLDVNGSARVSGIIYGTNGITDPTVGTNAGTTLALNGNSPNNNYSIGLAAVRSGAYDMFFQTGAVNGGGYRWYIGATEKMTISYRGDVRIGRATTSTSRQLELFKQSGDTSDYYIICENVSQNKFLVDGAGTIYAVNTTVQSSSDARLKENIRVLDTGLNEILNLKPRRFDWKKDEGLNIKNDIGFIAQEVEEILPDLVMDYPKTNNEDIQYKSLGMSKMIPTLVKAIQEQQTIIEDLKARIEKLEV